MTAPTSHADLAYLARILDEQEKALDSNKLDLYKPHAGQVAFHKSSAKVRMLITGNRWGKCVTFRTLIDRPDGSSIPIGEIKGRHWVLAWDGEKKVPVLADAPFKKPAEECFRVWMSDGRWFECAGNHRVLTEGGWQFFSTIRKFLPCLPASSSGLGVLTHISDVRHYLEKHPDCLGDYFLDCRQYDVQLHSELESDLISFPLLNDVQRHNFVLSWLDDLASRCANSLSSLLFHLSKRSEVLLGDFLSSVFLSPAFYTLNGLCLHDSQKLLRSYIAGASQLPRDASVKPRQSLFSSQLVSPDGNSKNQIVAYQSIGSQDIYDFNVPKYHNYCTQGVVHHNTTASVIEALWLALGIHPYHKIPTPNRGKMFGESFPTIDETIRLKIEEWCPRKFLSSKRPFIYNQMGHLIGVNFSNGSILRIGSYDQEEKKSEGSNWHYVAFDEPPPRNLYVANFRGIVDFGGIMWFSLTPLSEAWLYDDLWLPGQSGEKNYIECFSGVSSDNHYLNQENLKLYYDELTPEEREVRFFGKFSRLKGLVIDTYDPQLSDVDPFLLDSSYTIYEGIDPHPKKPHAALWKAISNKDNKRFVVGELKCADGIAEFGRQIAIQRRRLTSHGALLYKSVSDTSLNQDDPAFRMNLRDELCRALRESGESVMPQNAQKKDWLDAGITKLRDLYRPVTSLTSEFALPTEYVFKDCTAYKYELSHYQWPKKEILENTKPVSKDNDLIDCNRYIESLAPEYQTPGTRSLVNNYNGAYQRLSGIERDLNNKMKHRSFKEGANYVR